MPLLAQRHRDWGCLLVLPTSNLKYRFGGLCRGSPAVLLRKCKRLQVAGRQKELAWKAVAQPHLPMSLLAQRYRDWGCMLVLLPQTSNVSRGGGVLPVTSSSSTPKMSPDSSHPEGHSLASCFSASSAHGPARTEAQRLGLLACLATPKFKRIYRMGFSVMGAISSSAPKI